MTQQAQAIIMEKHLAEGYKISSDEIINETLLCSSISMPDISSYFQALGPVWSPVLLSSASLVVFCILILFLDTLRHVTRHDRPAIRSDIAVVISVYPIIALSCLATLVVPRAILISEAVTQITFMVAAQRFFWLIVTAAGASTNSTNHHHHSGSCSNCVSNNGSPINGNAVTVGSSGAATVEQDLVRAVKLRDARLSLRTPPCCCWPCLRPLLPDKTLTESHVKNMSYLVLQLPVIQTLIYLILLVMWAEHESIYELYYVYFQPAVVASIFIGIWGITMTLKLASNLLTPRSLQARFLCLQLVLICAKLQGLVIRSLASNGVLPCDTPLTHKVYGNLIQSSALLCEMLLLAVWARNVYRRPLMAQEEVFSNPAAEHRIEKDNNNMGLANTTRWSEMKDNAYVIENQFGENGAHRGRRLPEAREEGHM